MNMTSRHDLPLPAGEGLRERENAPTLTQIFLLTTALTLLCGCATGGKKWQSQTSESVMCIGEESAALAYLPRPGKALRVHSHYWLGAGTTNYIEGQDYVVDYARGTLHRTPTSRIPDFRKNMLYGQKDFDHSKFPGFGNTGFFAFVDYEFAPTTKWPVQPRQDQFLKATHEKLTQGKPLKMVAFGDSIATGGDATKPELIFWQRWADDLQRKYPQSKITAVNAATGGGNTASGLQRLQEKVLNEKPDLVLIGFGMNDHNVRGVPIPQFEQNLHEMIKRIRKDNGAEIVLFSAFPPNPHWKFGSHHMEDYAKATEKVAREANCAFADVFNNWQAQMVRKKPEDILGNNINHPNDFGHWVYYRVFCELGL